MFVRRSEINKILVIAFLIGIGWGEMEPFPVEAAQDRWATAGTEMPRYFSDHAQRSMDEDVRILKRALQFQLENLGPKHEETIRLFRKLAEVYENAGDSSQSLVVYEQLMDLLDSNFGRNHPHVRAMIPQLMRLYKKLGRIPQDEKSTRQFADYLKEDIAIMSTVLSHQMENLGGDHAQVLQLEMQLAQLYYYSKDWYESEVLYQNLIARYSERYQEEIMIAPLLHRYGEVLWHQNKLDEAYRVTRQSVESYKRIFGVTHPKVAEALRQLIMIAMDNRDEKNAQKYARELFEIEDTVARSVLSITSEKDRFDYLAKHNPYAFPALLKDVDCLASAVLRYKGIILDSLIEDIRRAEQDENIRLRQLIRQRKSIKEKLAEYYFDEDGIALKTSGRDLKDYLRKLHREVDVIEREIAHYVAGMDDVRKSLQTRVKEVQAQIPKDAVLVEYVRYPKYLRMGEWEDYYGVMILLNEEPPVWITLGKARNIDQEIQSYHQLISGESNTDQRVSDVLRVLYRHVWEPIEKKVDLSSRTIILSPDGMINFISFATLLDDQEFFLTDKHSIHYIMGGRDLLRKESLSSDNNQMLIFSNPRYASDKKETKGVFPLLPGSAIESQKIEALGRKSDLSVKIFTGEAANEKNLREVQSPRILHIAAHGFFDEKSMNEISLRKYPVSMMKDSRYLDGLIHEDEFQNPMHRSGIALATEVHSSGQPQDLEQGIHGDGILTADEISLLNLNGTWLVVVPACYTGLGSLHAVEGLVGLRRGFVMAGGQNIVMALWRVNDRQTTPDFIEDFYRAVFKTGDPVEALWQTQKSWLNHLREKKGIASAVKEVGPFVLVSKENYTHQ